MKALRYLRDALVFAPCYVALDWTSHVYPLGPFNITPWNPQAALAIVWMLLAGVRYLPAVAATIFIADVIVRGAPGGYALIGITAVALASGYAGLAYVLRDHLGPTPSVNGTRPLALFAVVTIAGTGLVAATFIAVLQGADFLTDSSFVIAWLRFWVGDGVGVLVTAPLLLAAADAESRRAFIQAARRPETIAQTAALIATGWFVFRGADVDPAKLFYLFFVPLIWIVVRAGMAGALIAIAIAQLAVVLGIHSGVHTAPEVFELQVFVAALTLTALFLGVTVEERQRAATTLQQSLRLAAAGEMAGAVAHEVNQPLTALANYGRSAQLVLARNGEGAGELASIVDRMLAEGQRAGEILRRVRDFFRAGTTRLEAVQVDEVLAAARRIAEQAIGSRPLTFAATSDPALPPLYVDRLQIELILRNLISNAVEATAAQASGEIRVMAEREDAHHVRLAVADSGPGVAAGVRGRLFEPFSSSKSSGMGLGLAVSRAIAEAHGGSLDLCAGRHGEFHLVLPCVQES